MFIKEIRVLRTLERHKYKVIPRKNINYSKQQMKYKNGKQTQPMQQEMTGHIEQLYN